MAAIIPDIVHVKVNPTELLRVSEATYLRIAELRASLEAISKFVTSTTDTWQGEAADAYRAVFNNEYAHAMQVLDQFQIVPKSLIDFADLYSEVIESTTEQANSIAEFSMM